MLPFISFCDIKNLLKNGYSICCSHFVYDVIMITEICRMSQFRSFPERCCPLMSVCCFPADAFILFTFQCRGAVICASHLLFCCLSTDTHYRNNSIKFTVHSKATNDCRTIETNKSIGISSATHRCACSQSLSRTPVFRWNCYWVFRESQLHATHTRVLCGAVYFQPFHGRYNQVRLNDEWFSQ